MDFVEQLKSSLDIVQVVGEYVRLRKAGSSRFVGLCPFHNEKTPSFGVHPGLRLYKCFGCGAGGDVLKFVMEIERLSFYETLKLLSERHGIPMPKKAGYSDPDSRLRAAIYQMHEIATEAYSTHLNGPAGADTRAYLGRRGISADAVREFGIGYSDRSGRFLLRLFDRHNFTAEQLEASGLVKKRPDGSFYDAFRNRLMFPIHNESGKVIGFGGRAIEPGDEPKYLNSSDSPIYTKRYVLYNLHRAKKDAQKADRTVLVEGYMDVIGVWSAGIHEVMATCGTALTTQQAQTMKRHSERIVVNFDPDTAGANAAERSIHLLLDAGMHVRILELDGGLDPDEYCKQRGAEAYREKLDNARSYFHWLADRARAKFDQSAEGRMAGFQQILLPAINRLGDKLERMAVANDLAAYLGVDTSLVLEHFRKTIVDRREQKPQPPRAQFRADEKLLLRILLTSPDSREQVIPELKTAIDFDQLPTGRIFRALISLYESGSHFGYHEVHDRLQEQDQKLLEVAVLVAQDLDDSVSPLDQAAACLQSLQNSGQKARLAVLKSRIREAERAGNLAEAIQLMEELNRTSTQ